MNTRTRLGIRLAAIAATALSMVAFAPLDDTTFSLKRVAKVGDELKFKLSVDLTVEGTAVHFSANIAEKVTKVTESGDIHVESKQSGGKLKMGDQEMELPDDSPSTTIYNGKGGIVEIVSDKADPTAYRMANMLNLMQPEKPVKAGDKWTQETKANAKTGALAGKAEFEVIGAEKVAGHDTVKIKFSYKETEGAEPASSEGTAWFDAKDASLVKAAGKFKNAPLPGMPGPVDLTFEQERI